MLDMRRMNCMKRMKHMNLMKRMNCMNRMTNMKGTNLKQFPRLEFWW